MINAWVNGAVFHAFSIAHHFASHYPLRYISLINCSAQRLYGIFAFKHHSRIWLIWFRCSLTRVKSIILYEESQVVYFDNNQSCDPIGVRYRANEVLILCKIIMVLLTNLWLGVILQTPFCLRRKYFDPWNNIWNVTHLPTCW